MVKIVAVDVGLVNLGVAAHDSSTNASQVFVFSLLNPENKQGVRYKYAESMLPWFIQQFLFTHAELFHAADYIVVEQQMKRMMLIIQHSLASFLLAWGKQVRFIRPVDVRQYFGISMNNYKKNKQASVDLVLRLFKSKKRREQLALERFGTKLDDPCEALLLALYAASNQTKLQTIESTDRFRKPYTPRPKATKTITKSGLKKRKTSSDAGQRKPKVVASAPKPTKKRNAATAGLRSKTENTNKIKLKPNIF